MQRKVRLPRAILGAEDAAGSPKSGKEGSGTQRRRYLGVESNKDSAGEDEGSGKEGSEGSHNKEGKHKDLQTLYKFDLNFDTCNVCGEDAEHKLICCSSCPRVYHMACVELTRVPKGIWHCPVCENRDKECTICKAPLTTSADPKRIRCDVCLCVMHFACVEVPLKLLLRTPKYWHKKEEELLSQNPPVFDYICHDCQRALGVESVLDSYNYEEKKENAMVSNNYYFVKFKTLAHLHSVWVSSSELKTYVAAGKMGRFEQQFADEEVGDMSDIIEDDINRSGIREEYLELDKVIDKWTPNLEDCDVADVRYLVKWRGLPYDTCTWEREHDIENFKDRIERYEKLKLTETQLQSGELDPAIFGAVKPSSKFKKLDKQPDFVTKQGTLLEYQLEGLNWMLYSWYHNTNIVLADEMGLGKTIECLVFLRYLHIEVGNKGPFLICAPLSTIENWSRECGVWYPEANVVTYIGSKPSRAVIRKKELYFAGARGPDKECICKFNILLTSYEMVRKDATHLKKITWRALVADEGHKIKNKQSKTFTVFQTFQADFRLLMTGTPLQNNLSELLTLMQFISPDKFTDDVQEKMLKQFEEIKLNKSGKVFDAPVPETEPMKDIPGEEDAEAAAEGKKKEDDEQLARKQQMIDQLHAELKPHMLRRMKKDVLPNLPRKKEIIVRVDLTKWQKQLYRCIFTRNFPALKQLDKKRMGKATVSIKSLTNVLMMLRLCANHGLLLTREFNSRLSAGESFERKAEEAKSRKAEEEKKKSLMDAGGKSAGTDGENEFAPEVVTESGKMQLLDMMLRQLKEEKHKVLIFSQFKIMLDIIEDYLDHMKYKWLRLDGGTPSSQRQQLIDSFNDEGEDYFVFLLSTRAGGLGINLAAADTVIIFDSDFNPHNDIQALSRAHRIGQKHVVMMYRLVSKDTIEEKIIELAKQKLMIEHLLVKEGKSGKSSINIIDKILRFGTEKLFNDGAANEQNIVYNEEAVKKLLDRTQAMEEETKKATTETEDDKLIDDYLSKFNVAHVPAEEAPPENKKQDKEEDKDLPPDYWTKLLREQYEKDVQKEQEMYGKGKRKHNKINYDNQCASEESGNDEGYYEAGREEVKDSASESLVSLTEENPDDPKRAQKRKRAERPISREKLTCKDKCNPVGEGFWKSLDLDKLNTSAQASITAQYVHHAFSIAQQLVNTELYILPIGLQDGRLTFTSQDARDADMIKAYQLNLSDSVDLRTSFSIIWWGFNELNRRDFVEAFMKFGVADGNWKELYDRYDRLNNP